MISERQLSYEILKASYIDGQYANLIMRKRLNELPKQQRPFVTEIVNGVIRNDIKLRANFERYFTSKTKMSIIIILMMAYYEKHYLQHPNYVVVNEYVGLTKKQYKAFINGFLRNHLDDFNFYEVTNNLEEVSIKYSLPLWIVKLLKAQYNDKDFEYLLNDYQEVLPSIFYHLNSNKIDSEVLKSLDVTFITDKAFISKNNLIDHDLFKNGSIYVQDLGSQMIGDALDLQDGDFILDMCAAPGSKTFNMLENIDDDTNFYINDISALRLELIKSKAINLGYQNLNFINYDGLKLGELGINFDKILLDAPCSGLGVIKRKTDLKNRIRPENLDELVSLQQGLLEVAATILKKGGQLVYSTCTLNRKENDRQIRNFLTIHQEFELIDERLILPEKGSDAFYFAKMTKIK